jgi:two-component system chemotaxis response regulator CheY
MIVDDELFFREVLRDLLENAGFSIVAEAVNGKDAVEKYLLHRPEITIMDVFMPEKHGIDATREIMAQDSNAKILICSGVGYEEDVEAALQAGARGMILKPFFAQEVTDMIDKVIAEN